MTQLRLAKAQQQLIELQYPSKVFLSGPAGSGKTTAAVVYLSNMIASGINADTICIIAPQRNLLEPYSRMLNAPGHPGGPLPNLATFGGLARRMVSLFWPLVVEPAAFTGRSKYPTFLTHETAQYYLAKAASPVIDQENYFEDAVIGRNRLFSQIIDNLNKAAIIGYPFQTSAEKLQSAWTGESAFANVYEQAQHCAQLFRTYCLQNNMLDFSLQVEVFRDHIWSSPLFRTFWFGRNRHLIYDNVEEDAPVFHDLALDWLSDLESALVISDDDGGFRTFLAADPVSAGRFAVACNQHQTLQGSHVQNQDITTITNQLSRAIQGERLSKQSHGAQGIKVFTHRFVPEMVAEVCHNCAELLLAGVPAREIVVVSPFLSDTLLFAILSQMQAMKIPVVASRPSRSLVDEPAARCLLTWAKLAHRSWSIPCTREEVRSALLQSIYDSDLIKADLLSRIVYKDKSKELLPFQNIDAEVQHRITQEVGSRYEAIRDWLMAYASGEIMELDVCLSRLFGELLSQPGFRMHDDLQQAAVCSRLIESVRKFRQAVISFIEAPLINDRGEETLKVLLSGILAATPSDTNDQSADAILISPAYAYLMQNRPVEIQIWLDIGSRAWWERLYQPLTHPYVLSRQWTEGRKWTDSDEVRHNQQMLEKLVVGLARRCKRQLVFHACGINEQGYEDRGALLRVIQSVLRVMPHEEGADCV